MEENRSTKVKRSLLRLQRAAGAIEELAFDGIQCAGMINRDNCTDYANAAIIRYRMIAENSRRYLAALRHLVETGEE